MTTDGPASPPPPSSAGTQRSHRIRNALFIAAAFVAALGAVAGGALFFFYDRAVSIDRSTPEIVTDQFLEATLLYKDPARTSLFICDGWSAEAAMTEVDAPTDPSVSASWEDMTATVSGSTAVVSVRVILRIAVEGGAHRQSESWTLELSNQDGWRVCGVTKGSSFNP